MSPFCGVHSMTAQLLGLVLVVQAGLSVGDGEGREEGRAVDKSQGLFSQIVSVLGNGQDSRDFLYSSFNDIPTLTTQLRPMLIALPDDGHGMYGPSSVRFALHSLFVQRHGWVLEGLDPEGLAWNSTSPSHVTVLRKMPSAVRELVEKRFEAQGFSLEDTAVFAATIEHLVHAEATKRLHDVYSTLGLQSPTAQSRKTVQLAIDAYMGTYVWGVEPSTLNQTALLEFVDTLSRTDMQPSWLETREFATGFVNKEAQLGHLNFAGASHAVASMGESYGQWQNKACLAIKDNLMALEDKDTGRVPLRDFYTAALKDGRWEFSESAEYLRALGVLDDSLPGNPRVIIPNYINNPANCLAASQFYSVCCINECEDIRRRIELGIGAPDATPQKILSVVATINSTTVPARKLSELMQQRLRHIAQLHDGKVPLFGRLFAQWLHHAFPRECPYPYLSASHQKSFTQGEWEAENPGMKAQATENEMHRVVDTAQTRSSGPTVYGRWTDEEELVVATPAPTSLTDTIRSVLMV